MCTDMESMLWLRYSLINWRSLSADQGDIKRDLMYIPGHPSCGELLQGIDTRGVHVSAYQQQLDFVYPSFQ